ncbi:nSTAND1 domain-containing NTPase [Streptomyces chrestomyceticus]|uniref:nSTAND1 domain-containing NTPase n=1 Tax=Streptomyces chrestomyceticus TaxID=68185 RepID=UPI001F499906|nr:hypothetical protein [Streptomyces chrestomyceticus]
MDQYEELFTLRHDPSQRAGFLRLLLAARAADSGLRVVLDVRADFYGRLLELPELAAAITRWPSTPTAAHRPLGGKFRCGPALEGVACKHYACTEHLTSPDGRPS